MELNSNQMYHLIERFPEFNHSYETISQKGYSAEYNIALAIPIGKKNYAWFTFYRDSDVCYIFDLNKDKKISKSTRIMKEDNNPLGKGTILYGTSVVDEVTNASVFVIEDMYFYKGIPLGKMTFYDKLFYIKAFLDDIKTCNISIAFKLPVMWENMYNSSMSSTIHPAYVDIIGYDTHHIQYRTTTTIMPYINVVLNMKNIPVIEKPKQSTRHPSSMFHVAKYAMDLNKPQYRHNTIFKVMADIQYDIYHLYAYGKENMIEYYEIAYIPDYKTSVFMNSLFRTIRENKNLDYIEESDDEDDFQNINSDKYVDLQRTLTIECVFHTKFKRWVPIKVVPNNSKVIHISRLVKNYTY